MFLSYRPIFYSLFFLTTIPSLSIFPGKDKLLKKMISFNNPRIFMLSYPRSGNTWLRYCLEVLTQRSTAHIPGLGNPSNWPLGLMGKFPLDFSKAPIWKIHHGRECPYPKPLNDLLIFLVRNPKEVLIRHNHVNLDEVMTFPRQEEYARYFNNLKIFAGWPANKKILIYYEDLMTNPRAVLERILLFLGDSIEPLDDFFKNYQKHKEIALDIYKYNGDSETRGEDLLHHSRKVPESMRRKFDVWLKLHYHRLWRDILKERYAEEVLHYNS